MNNIENLEIALIILIVILQFYSFLKTGVLIRNFKTIFKEPDSYFLVRATIPLEDLNKMSPLALLGNLIAYQNEYEEYDANFLERFGIEKISIIQEKANTSLTFKRIVFSINTYLLKNRGAAADFTLLKDIVERNCDAMEGDINNSVSVPLYLGLMGTLIGVVIGLFQMSDITGNPTLMGRSIAVLLSGVKVAMFASFMGLLFTVYNSSQSFKKAKTIIEQGKNDFYTFLQTELLPVLGQNVAATLQNLQTNFAHFNNDFSSNISKLSTIMNRNYDALIAQDNVLNKLQEIDINTFVKANINVLKELQKTMLQFETFNSYVNRMSDFIESTYRLTDKVDGLLRRTDNFEAIANTIQSTITANAEMIQFLRSHETLLDESKQQLVYSVNSVNGHLDKSLKDLAEFTTNSFTNLRNNSQQNIDILSTFTKQNIEKFKLEIEDLQNKLKQAFAADGDNLAKLTLLEPMNQNISAIKANSQQNTVAKRMESVETKMDEMVAVLNKIEKNGIRKVVKNGEVSSSVEFDRFGFVKNKKKHWWQVWKKGVTRNEKR